MLKMDLADFLEEIKAELVGYEEVGEERAFEWEKRFMSLLDDKKITSMKINYEGRNTIIVLKDESELFQIADGFWVALENDEIEQYWSSFVKNN